MPVSSSRVTSSQHLYCMLWVFKVEMGPPVQNSTAMLSSNMAIQYFNHTASEVKIIQAGVQQLCMSLCTAA